MMKNLNNKHIINFVVSFYKFTHYVEKVVDNYIEDKKNKIINTCRFHISIFSIVY